MRKIAMLGVVVLLGCGGDEPAGAGKGNPADPRGLARQPWSAPPPATPKPAAYRGKSVPQWAERLKSNDPKQTHAASLALRALQDEGVPHLIQGLHSPASDTRLACLQALDSFHLAQHRAQTLPLLVRFLNDRNPNLRQQAAARLAAFGKDARDALPALQKTAETDENADVRNAAAGSVIDIQEAVTGQRSPDG